jgi:hypothetical protein
MKSGDPLTRRIALVTLPAADLRVPGRKEQQMRIGRGKAWRARIIRRAVFGQAADG